jgi:hypothetical protein
MVTGLQELALAQSSLTLAWDPSTSSAIAGYRLYEGGASQIYTNVITVGNVTTQTVSSLRAGVTYYFSVTAYDGNGLESDFSNEISYTVSSPSPGPPGTTLTFAADSGTFTAPFVATNGTLRQPVATGLSGSGRAVYSFNIANAGNYLVSVLVRAPNLGRNSFYVNIDAEPTDPLMIWDIPVCASLTGHTVSWRGNGNSDPALSQYAPKVFALSADTHQLIIRGREGDTVLGAISITAAPPKLQIQAVLGGATTLIAAGQPNQTCGILCSQDLKAWTIIGTMTLDENGEGQFTDPASNSRASRFYRLQEQ